MNAMRSFNMKWMLCCLLIFQSGLLLGEEKLFIPFDDRPWKIGFESRMNDEKITELVLQNEEITQWSELFTVQIFEGFSISASDFMTLLERSSKAHLPPHENIQFKVLEKDPAAIFEMSFMSNSNPSPAIDKNEHNIGRVIKGKKALYYLRYSTKNANLFKQEKEAWMKRLQSAYLASSPRENGQDRWMAFTSNGIYDQEKKLVYQAEYQLIHNKKVGYGLSIPKTWTTQKTEAKPSVVFNEALRFNSPDHTIEGKVSFFNLPEGASLKSAKLEYYHTYKKEHPQAKLINKGHIHTILGKDGHYFILVNEGKIGWITFIYDNQRVYCLELWTQRDQFEDFRKTLESIILNFQVQ